MSRLGITTTATGSFDLSIDNHSEATYPPVTMTNPRRVEGSVALDLPRDLPMDLWLEMMTHIKAAKDVVSLCSVSVGCHVCSDH